MYKQGVCHDNIRWSFLNDDTRNLSGKECSFNNKGFKDMIQGVYPSLEEALKLLPSKGRNHEIAISNNIALVWKEKLRLTYVYYKTEEHGFIVDGTRKVIVPKDEFGWVISHYLSGFDWEVE